MNINEHQNITPKCDFREIHQNDMGSSMALFPRIGLMAKGNQGASVQACSNHLISKQLGKNIYKAMQIWHLCWE